MKIMDMIKKLRGDKEEERPTMEGDEPYDGYLKRLRIERKRQLMEQERDRLKAENKEYLKRQLRRNMYSMKEEHEQEYRKKINIKKDKKIFLGRGIL